VGQPVQLLTILEPGASFVVLHGVGMYTRGRPKEQIGFGKRFFAPARKLNMSPFRAVESYVDRLDEPRMLEPITGHRQN
jgi:hypothetical protein